MQHCPFCHRNVPRLVPIVGFGTAKACADCVEIILKGLERLERSEAMEGFHR